MKSDGLKSLYKGAFKFIACHIVQDGSHKILVPIFVRLYNTNILVRLHGEL